MPRSPLQGPNVLRLPWAANLPIRLARSFKLGRGLLATTPDRGVPNTITSMRRREPVKEKGMGLPASRIG